jgi:putative Holliday junction resolvase
LSNSFDNNENVEQKPTQAIAFDFGTKHIGVAIGQTITANAQGLTQLKANNGLPNWEEVDAIFQEWKPDIFVIGLPLNMDGSSSHMSQRAKKFSNRLADRYNIPCHLFDERLSSVEAREQLIQAQKNKEMKQQSEIDSLAAAVILRSWLTQI